jgi:hypothetical protein
MLTSVTVHEDVAAIEVAVDDAGSWVWMAHIPSAHHPDGPDAGSSSDLRRPIVQGTSDAVRDK